MGLKLEKVVPWGRSSSEYCRMFGLTQTDLEKTILDCAGGPASFNAEMTRQGYSVISCDPVYQFTVHEIEQRITETYITILEGVSLHQNQYVWQGQITSPLELGEVRMAAMKQFLDDFPEGLKQKRYLAAELPNLPFVDQQFDLALCSHFLFTYSDHFSYDFHLQALLELLRVAHEVRVFPLLTISGESYPDLDSIIQALQQADYQVQIQSVPYEFQQGGNQMLQIFKQNRL